MRPRPQASKASKHEVFRNVLDIIGMLVSLCRFHTSNFFFGTHYSYRSTMSYGATRSSFWNENKRIYTNLD